MTVLRGILAVLAGTLAAALAGIGANFGNQQFHWVEPAYGYMYFYPWLTLIGGALGAGLSGALFALWNR
ncbi:MAG: hypothetical protein JW910_17545, partial [Anaerolineae bacterium]|nr:hypothetical protein [Anaerolineae bacterium]